MSKIHAIMKLFRIMVINMKTPYEEHHQDNGLLKTFKLPQKTYEVNSS